MASSDCTSSLMENDLESMIECPIHYGILVQPKSLPCGHVICLGCIQRWVEARMGILMCPECNSEQILPRNGVDGLPNAYRLTQLCDYLGKLDLAKGVPDPVVKCSGHPDLSLDRICHDCKQPVCQACVKADHSGHKCLDTGSFVRHMDRPLKRLEKKAREQQEVVGKSCTEMVKLREQLQANRDASLRTIDQFVEGLVTQASAAGKQLREGVEAMYAEKECVLGDQEQTLKEMTEDINRVVSLVSVDSHDGMASLPSLMDDASRQLKEIQNKTSQSTPKTSSDIRVEMDQSIFDWFQPKVNSKRIGRIFTSQLAYPNESMLMVVSETPTLLSNDVEVELTLNDAHGRKVEVHDTSVVSAEVITANGKRIKQIFEIGAGGKITTNFQPQSIGKYRLIAKVFNRHVKNSPLNIMVQPRGVASVELRGKTAFRSPHDVRQVGDNFIVLDEQQVQVVDGEGRMVNKFVINDTVFHPYAIAYHQQAYYITALKGQKAVKFSKTGLPVINIGVGVLQAPTGIAVSRSGDIYIADDKKGCIFVFSSDGTLLHQIGTPGNGEGELDHPWFIKFNSRGQLVVVDSGNQRVQIFDPETGKGVKSIYVEHQGKPLSCRGVDLDRNDNIYVTARALIGWRLVFGFECVLVYNPEGEFIGTFAESPPRRGLHFVRGIHVVDRSNKTTAIVVDGANSVVRLYVV